MEGTTPLSAGREGGGWHLALRRHRLIPRFVAGLAGVSIVLAAVQLAHGHLELAFLLAVVAAAFAPAPWWHNRRRADRTRVDSTPDPGLLLPVNPSTWAFAASALLLGAGFVEAGVALAMRAADEGDSAAGVVVLVPVCGLGLLLLIVAVAAMRSRFRRGLGLLLTPDAIVVATGRRPLRVPWNAVVAIRPHWVRMVDDWIAIDDEVRNLLTIQVHRRLVARRPRPLDASRLACRPELALAILRFYLDHPEARHELGSSASLDRVRSMPEEQ